MLKKLFLYILLLVLVMLYACSENITDNPVGNKPPVTRIFLAPDSSISKQASRIRLYWTGDDPDGKIAGFYYSFDGVSWSFTTGTSRLFELKIGAVDTIFNFRVAAADDNGNGVYDSQVFQNNINFGHEPYIDANKNGQYDAGEFFVDIGLIDPDPATLVLPVKNSAPVVQWNTLSTVPDSSYPVMSFGWNAFDLDGNETIVLLKVALNDTANAVELNGAVRNITIRTKDFSNGSPLMDILIDGSQSNIASVKLPGLQFNSNNKIFVQAEDISGAKSKWISLPDSAHNWYVKKPKGKILIIDDYKISDDAPSFYSSVMDSLGLRDKFDVLNLSASGLPYLNTTFYETIKLYSALIWYTDNDPSLDLANAVVQKYVDAGGKIFFSMQFPQSVDLTQIQGFLTPVSTDSSYYNSIVGPGKTIGALNPGYPDLVSSTSFARVRAFYLSNIGVTPLYNFPNGELKGYIGFETTAKNIFFIGAPLQKMRGRPGVKDLLNRVLFNDFNLTP